MSAQERATGEGQEVFLEGDQEESRRRDFEVGGGGVGITWGVGGRLTRWELYTGM